MSTIKVSQINKKIKLLPEDLLQEVNDYIDFLTFKYAQNDWANELTNEQIALVEKGKKDIIENKTISHHEARKKIDDYIKNKTR